MIYRNIRVNLNVLEVLLLKKIDINSNCVKCFRCISVCPVKYCNKVGSDGISVNEDLCIGCGSCIKICTHHAREFDSGLSDIFNDEKIPEKSVFIIDIDLLGKYKSSYKKVIAFLKNNGIGMVRNLDEGISILNANYNNYLSSSDNKIVISSDCASAVAYIELYKSAFIQNLIPLDSSHIHLVKKVIKEDNSFTESKFYILTNCLEKKLEFARYDYRTVAVNSDKFIRYLDNAGLGKMTETEEFDGNPHITDVVSSPNIHTKRISSIDNFNHFMKGIDIPSLSHKIYIDLKLCSLGCRDHAAVHGNANKVQIENSRYFQRGFSNNSSKNTISAPDKNSLNSIYTSMRKSDISDIRNCTSCGYNSCFSMARAIHNGLNQKDNCYHYIKNKLSYIAYHDELTGLMNRSAFYETLKNILKNDQSRKAVLIIDIDDFRNINDTLGHESGNEVLKETAHRLQELIGKEDVLFRIGGDEFGIVLLNMTGKLSSTITAERIKNSFNKPIKIGSSMIYVNLSIGISVSPENGNDYETLVKKAETALYEAKKERNNHKFFEKSMHDKMLDKINTVSKLREAITNEEFTLFYQPQMKLDGSITGAEALIRWNKPDTGLVSPAKFIQHAEESGLIIPIGEWVLEKACSDYVKLRQLGLGNMSMSVNLSVKQFKDKELISRITQIISKTGIDPSMLHLEITESFLIDNEKDVADMINKLKEIGIKISLDDFGTGYSCLNYLDILSLNSLKIDKHFIDQITPDGRDVPLVDTIIAISKGLKLDIVAEGVTQYYQIDYLKKFNYNINIQGFYYSEPIPIDKFIDFAKKYKAG